MVGAAEFTGPVAYAPWLTWLAVLLPVLVLAYYLGVTWWARPPRVRRPPEPRQHRREHLEQLDAVEREVAAGSLGLREAHQAISRIVRSFAAEAGPVDVRTMTLEQLRAGAPSTVVDLVALVYPPEFAPGTEGAPAQRLDRALADARAAITEWQP
ncbi:hypothetical protein [Nocardioides dongkuii]|uniref:hypothetical protein n=1 Tax=Nocardioides dongkuii TaxID=2760089 RepID=UPI0015FAA0F6|nr:hypothetical protein [Nocardioides dongkuii]